MLASSTLEQLKTPQTTTAIRLRSDPLTIQAALSRLYQQHAGHLIRYLQRNYGFGPPEPEDTVQDVFTRFGSCADWQQIENPKAYLYKMAVNQTLNALKRQRQMNGFLQQQLVLEEEPLDELGPEQLTAKADQLRQLDAAMALLSDKQKDILIRSRLKGQTYAEIASATGWSQADICRQLYAALSALQQASL